MFLMIVLPLFGFGIALIMCYRKSFYEGWVGQSVIGALCGLLVALGIALWVQCSASTHQVHQAHVQLYALRGNVGPEGTFFLGSGTINNEPSYTFFYTDKDSTGATFYKQCTVPAKHARVYEQDRSDAELEVTVAAFDNPTLSYFTWSPDVFYYDFYIPKGSIERQYTL